MATDEIQKMWEEIIAACPPKSTKQRIRDWYEEFNPDEFQIPMLPVTVKFEKIMNIYPADENTKFPRWFICLDTIVRDNIYAAVEYMHNHTNNS